MHRSNPSPPSDSGPAPPARGLGARTPYSALLLAGLALTGQEGHAQSSAPRTSEPASGEDTPLSLADWDIEDLLAVRVPSMTTVLGGHVHNKGEWMPMFHAMYMRMEGLRDGTDDLSTSDVLDSFMVSPTEMTTEMYMTGLMYGWSDQLTLMVMVPYVRKSMDHLTGTGVEFTTRSEGIGDAQLSALYTLWESYDRHLHLNMGLSAPTGSVDERDDTPMGPDSKLPYPMQLGSGTWDLQPGLTYLHDGDAWGWGAQGVGTLRLGENDQDYTLGDRFRLTAWTHRRLSEGISGSVRVVGQAWGNVEGADPDLNPAVVPTADPDRQGGERVDLGFGLQLFQPEGRLAGHRLELEISLPVYESLDGPQMSTEYWATLGWSITL